MAEIIGYIGRAQTLTAELSTPQTLTASFGGGGTAHGIPAGGEPGQGLIKVSDADYDVKWMDILPEDTASGSVASFPDGADDLPMGVVVDVDPVQDLHGYDNPWPEGGGKNLIRPTGTTETINGVTFTMNDGTVTVNGTASALTVYYVARDLALKSGSYLANGCPNGGGNTTFGLRVGNVLADVYSANDASFTVSSDTTTNVTIIIRSGYTANNLVFKPMIRLSSVTDNTYSPYSNICPISGWTGAEVTRTGRNMLDIGEFGFYHGTMTKNEDGSITIATTSTSSLQRQMRGLLKAGRYTISNLSESLGMYVQKSGADYSIVVPKGSSKTFDYDGVSYLRFLFVNQAANTTTTYKLQLELGSAAHAYEPYTAVTHEIPFSTEVYGGTLNVETGECVVTHALERITSFSGGKESNGFRTSQILSNYVGLAYPEIMCNMFQGARSYAEAMSSKKNSIGCNDHGTILLNAYVNGAYVQTFSELNALIPPEGCEIWYPITPITLTLDPVEIRSLIGDNNVWSDTGDVSVIYKANIQGYIDKKISAAVAAMS